MPDLFINSNQKRENTLPTKNPVIIDVKPHAPGFFTSYCPNPSGVHFANQEPDEHIVLFLRRHFITNIPWLFYALLFLFIPPLLFFLINLSNTSVFTITPEFIYAITGFYYLLVLNYAFSKFITWFYHVGIVTPKRLIDLDVDNILHYHLAETSIADVVDVSYSQKGIFQSFFNYGDVPIQTEAIKANFEFEKSPFPSTVADIITDLRHDQKGKNAAL